MLLEACWLADPWKARRALEMGADVNKYNFLWEALEAGASMPHQEIFYDNLIILLIEHGIDIKAGTPQSSTALCQAAANGWTNAVKLLDHYGATILLEQIKTGDLLVRVASHGRKEIAKILLKNWVDPNLKGSTGIAPLHAAVAGGHVDTVNLLLKYEANVNIISNKEKLTPLFLAFTKDRKEIVRALLKHGAEVNIKNSNNMTPLHKAAQNHALNSIKLLLEYGADINAEDNNKYSPLFYALLNGKDEAETVDLLLRNGAKINPITSTGWTPLLIATQKQAVKCTAVLLKNGAEVNVHTEDHYTPLLHAITKNHPQIAALLLESGAEINCKNASGNTPLHKAAQKNAIECTKLLLRYGAEVNVVNNAEETPLSYAIQGDKHTIVSLLLAHKAEIYAKDVQGNTPFHKAILAQAFYSIRILLSYAVDTNSLNASQDTPFLSAIMTNQFTLVPLLLERGAKVNIANSTGETPLHEAVRKSAMGTIVLLLKKGANLQIHDSFGYSPLDIAIGAALEEEIKLLSLPSNPSTEFNKCRIKSQVKASIAIIHTLLDYGAEVLPCHLEQIEKGAAKWHTNIRYTYYMQQLIKNVPNMSQITDPNDHNRIIGVKVGDYIIHNNMLKISLDLEIPLNKLFNNKWAQTVIGSTTFLKDNLTQLQFEKFLLAIEACHGIEHPVLQEANKVKIMIEKLYTIALHIIAPELFPENIEDGHPLLQGPSAFLQYIEAEEHFNTQLVKQLLITNKLAENYSSVEERAKQVEKNKSIIHPLYTKLGKSILNKYSIAGITKLLSIKILGFPPLPDIWDQYTYRLLNPLYIEDEITTALNTTLVVGGIKDLLQGLKSDRGEDQKLTTSPLFVPFNHLFSLQDYLREDEIKEALVPVESSNMDSY
jgi:ankyrin repeat protein